jgi:hypothetical protein
VSRRGQAELDAVDGIPDEYPQWNGTYEMTPEQRAEWEAGVRSLYDGMVRVVVTPTWAKLIDFETTCPPPSRSSCGNGTNASAPEHAHAPPNRAAGPGRILMEETENYVANTAVTWPGRPRQIHSFFHNRPPGQMLDAAASWTSPWLPPGYEQDFWNAA